MPPCLTLSHALKKHFFHFPLTKNKCYGDKTLETEAPTWVPLGMLRMEQNQQWRLEFHSSVNKLMAGVESEHGRDLSKASGIPGCQEIPDLDKLPSLPDLPWAGWVPLPSVVQLSPYKPACLTLSYTETGAAWASYSLNGMSIWLCMESACSHWQSIDLPINTALGVGRGNSLLPSSFW